MTEQSTLISEELTLAGEASPVTPEIIALNSHRITTETQLKDQEYLFRLQDKPCFPRCDVTTITGPAKSGKTFFVSMLMACCAERQVLALERVREEPLSVLWLDTEQSRQSTKDILAGRIAKLVQTPFPDERFYVFNVRSATYKERREMMALAIETYRPDLVILDNISDLSFDINSGEESTGLMEQLMQLATNFECSIVSIIHLNRSGTKRDLRGWLGTVMLQKSYDVFFCEQLEQEHKFVVEQSAARKYNQPKKFYYEVDADGLPCDTEAADIQERDSQGRYLPKKADSRDSFESEFIIRHSDRKGDWEWDLNKLFSKAMADKALAGYEDLQQTVMSLTNIKQASYYDKVFKEAERQGIVKSTFDRCGRVAVVMPPPR